MPLTDSVILTWASAALYWAFIVSFVERNDSIFADRRFSVATSLSCWFLISAIWEVRLVISAWMYLFSQRYPGKVFSS